MAKLVHHNIRCGCLTAADRRQTVGPALSILVWLGPLRIRIVSIARRACCPLWREPERIMIADVAVKIAAFGEGRFKRSKGLNRHVQELTMLPAGYKPDRENLVSGS